jgi:hypothetical protein
MELDFIYEESHIVEYSTEDLLLDTDYVNEGVLSNIWEKVKKFFKAIKDFVVKYFNKFLDLFRKKSTKVTPNDVKACEETLKDPKAYTDNSKDDKEDSTPNGDTDPVMDDVEEPAQPAKSGKKFIRSKSNRKIVRRAKLSKDKTFKVKTIMVNGERVKDLAVIFQEEIYKGIAEQGAEGPIWEMLRSINLDYKNFVDDKADEALTEVEAAYKKIKETCVYSEVDDIIDIDFVTKNFKNIIKMMDQKYISDLIKEIKKSVNWFTEKLEARVENLKYSVNTVEQEEKDGEPIGLKPHYNFDKGIKTLNLIMSSSKLMVDFVIKLVTTQLMHANKVATEIYNYVKACADYRRYESLREYTELDEFYVSDLISEDVEGLDLNINDEYITEIEDRQYFDSQYILSIINRGA